MDRCVQPRWTAAGLLACVDVDGIRLYSVPAFKLVRTLANRSRYQATLAFSVDGKRLAAADEDSAAVWDIATGAPIAPIPGHTGSLVALAFLPNGKGLASSAFMEGNACLWDLASRKVRQRFGGQFCEATALAFTADGRMLATGDGSRGSSGGGERHIRLWDFSTDFNQLQLLDLATGKLSAARGLDHAERPLSLAVSGDGRTVAISCRDGRIAIYDVK